MGRELVTQALLNKVGSHIIVVRTIASLEDLGHAVNYNCQCSLSPNFTCPRS